MIIVHKIDGLLKEIFPDISEDLKNLEDVLKDYYKLGSIEPKIEILDDVVKIKIDISKVEEEQNKYNKLISLCESNRFDEAIILGKKLVLEYPTISEYHRVLGQVYSEIGKQENALNTLIDALKWNPKNVWALIMVGNIFSKYKNDIPTALKYYDQALVENPDDFIAINNIGANFMQQGKTDEAKKYFRHVLKINQDYPNTHHALAMIAEQEKDYDKAFEHTLLALKNNNQKDILYQNSGKQIFEIAQKLIAKGNAEKLVNEYKSKLEFEGNTLVEFIEDNRIKTAAKFEFAENYNRDKHLLKYKPNYHAVEHLIMHELVHLDFAIQARKEKVNQLFISTSKHKTAFIKSIETTVKKLRKSGIPEDSVNNFCSELFDGLNTQVYNAPIDLFIEDFLFNKFIALRPYQLLSLYNIIKEGQQSVTNDKVLELSPKNIVSKSKIYNLVAAIQLKKLYGLNLMDEFKATSSELEQANQFYQEFLEYKDDKEPAEEYELIIHWAKDLELDKFFELEGEIQYRKRTNIDSFMESFEKDPLGVKEKDPVKDREMKKFLEQQEDIGTNMAVVMYMVDALQYFEKMDKESIKKIAFEIAMQGTQGYNPDKKDYRVPSITGKVFSGYHILAYYYVSWALAIPEMLSQLQLPFDEEYKVAKTMHKKN